MVLVRKKEFVDARECGFVCKDPYTRTSHGKQYAISDDDYVRMHKYIDSKFKVTKYR